MMEPLVDQVDKMSDLWDYAAEKVGEDKATGLLSHLGMDNPHILRTKTLDECKNLIDKWLVFNKIANGG